jgi:hypothetical protein
VPAVGILDPMLADQDELELVLDQQREVLEPADLALHQRVAGALRDQAVQRQVVRVEGGEEAGRLRVARRLGLDFPTIGERSDKSVGLT